MKNQPSPLPNKIPNKITMPKEKQQLERILYENYTPEEGLGADEIDQCIDKILELLQAQKQELHKECQEYIDAESDIDWQLCERRIKKANQQLKAQNQKLLEKIDTMEKNFNNWSVERQVCQKIKQLLK